MADILERPLTEEQARQETERAELIRFMSEPEPEVETLGAGAGGRGIDSLLPLTKRAIGPGSDERFIAENARPGVPLQIDPDPTAISGAFGNVSPWIRFQEARRQNEEDQKVYLESKFGAGKVRRAKGEDNFIVEIPDPVTGKPRDVLLDEKSITLGDLADVAAHAPEIATTLLSMTAFGRIAKTPGVLRTLGLILSGAAGQKAGEAAQQVETRLEQGQPPEIGETIIEKGKEIPSQAGLDVATAGLFKGLSAGKRFAQGGAGIFKTPVQREGLAAAERLQSKTGLGLSYSAGESSGAPILTFLEAYAAAKPQATAIVQKFRDAQTSEAKAMGEALTAQSGSDEQIGEELLTFLSLNRNLKETALNQIRATMTAQESSALTKLLGKSAPVSAFKPSEAGGKLRDEFQSLYQGVKTRVRDAYADAYGTPGAALPEIPTKPIAEEIDWLLEQFPTTQGVQWLETYKKTFAGKESYRDIVQRRSDLWQRIEESPADRSTKDFIHGQLSKAMTETLDDASKNIINPQFRKKILAANSIYKKEELPFYQKGLRDVLLHAGDPGSPENIQLLKRFSASTDLYRRLVEVAGKNSEPVKQVKAAIADGLLQRSATSPIDGQFIDASQFVKNLRELSTAPETREMFNDVFGANGKKLIEEGRVLGAIQGTIPKDEAEALLTGTGSAAGKNRLRTLLQAQEQLAATDRRLLMSGTEDINTANPERLVNTFLSSGKESDIAWLRSQLQSGNPGLYAKVQDKVVEQILGKAGTYESWTRSNIEKVLNDAKMSPKYREILQDKFDDVADFAKALGPRQYAAEQAEGTGMLVKGSSIGALARLFKYEPGKGKSKVGEIFHEIPPWLGWKAAARFITSPRFREWAKKDFPPESSILLQSAIVSEPFLEDIATSSDSPQVLRDVVIAIRDHAKRVSERSTPKAPTNFQSRDEAIRFMEQ